MRTIRRLLKYAKRHWYLMLLTVICALVGTGIVLILPQVLRMIIDDAIAVGRQDLLLYYSIALVGLVIIKGIFGFGQAYLTDYVALRTIYRIRNRLFDHIQRLSFSYHDEAETGQLISRSTADVDALRAFLGQGLMHLMTNVLIFAGILPICLMMHWKLAVVALGTMPFLAFTVFRYGGAMRPLYTALQDQHGRLTAAIQQNLMGIRVVKSFAREDHEIDKFSHQSRELLRRRLATTRVQAFYSPLMDFIAAVGTTFILLYGGIQVINEHLTLGEFVAFNTYLGMLIWPVRIMGMVVDTTQNAIASANRVFEILDTHPEADLDDGDVEMHSCRGEVQFKNISFNYNDGSRALSNIDLNVEPGELIALVGATGSGKSTLINLLPRFYDVSEGELLIDGLDVRGYRLESLRRHIGIVAQETFLFGDTARGNIAYANPGASMEEVIEAAKSANIHSFIESLPEGYETRIGERGVNLSGGQKQRVAIARALLMNPPILILDDSTSSVDTETEALIQKALVSLTESRTTFVIAQRISTVKRADKVVVLDKGRVAEVGKHDELLVKGGLYAEICHLQLGGHEHETTGSLS